MPSHRKLASAIILLTLIPLFCFQGCGPAKEIIISESSELPENYIEIGRIEVKKKIKRYSGLPRYFLAMATLGELDYTVVDKDKECKQWKEKLLKKLVKKARKNKADGIIKLQYECKLPPMVPIGRKKGYVLLQGIMIKYKI